MEPFEPAQNTLHTGLGNGRISPIGGAGVSRHRILLVADRGGLQVRVSTAPDALTLARRMETMAARATVARFLWADSRLLVPGHFMAELVPSAGSAAASNPPENASTKPARALRWGPVVRMLRRAVPWLAAVAVAGIGYRALLQGAFRKRRDRMPF